ncbi:signal peptidase I [Streptococcus sciuri]|uniref:Signal peptidase I n=1 Tax=Streptococcus sciuri TaxID=2973939 RepID=A0ABT2F6U5_9STRE|nr:signal peptidase I [Streptococcus sciuri]MCS4487560.1 signal peptidase I [Streptococcus sciuri]
MVKRDFIRNIIVVIIAILALFLLQRFVFSSFKVHDDAANTYLSSGDIVLVNKNKEPQYKDFIVYEEKGIYYISRVIGTPGQQVTVMDDILYINNLHQEEPYIERMKAKFQSTNDKQIAFTSDLSISSLTKGKYETIPKGQYLVLNDNRQNDNDSRRFGLITKKHIKGVISFKIYPFNEFGFVKTE